MNTLNHTRTLAARRILDTLFLLVRQRPESGLRTAVIDSNVLVITSTMGETFKVYVTDSDDLRVFDVETMAELRLGSTATFAQEIVERLEDYAATARNVRRKLVKDDGREGPMPAILTQIAEHVITDKLVRFLHHAEADARSQVLTVESITDEAFLLYLSKDLAEVRYLDLAAHNEHHLGFVDESPRALADRLSTRSNEPVAYRACNAEWLVAAIADPIYPTSQPEAEAATTTTTTTKPTLDEVMASVGLDIGAKGTDPEADAEDERVRAIVEGMVKEAAEHAVVDSVLGLLDRDRLMAALAKALRADVVADVVADVADSIDAEDVASFVVVSPEAVTKSLLADGIDFAQDVANELDLSDIAGELDMEQLAMELARKGSFKRDIAEHLTHDMIDAIDLDRVADRIGDRITLTGEDVARFVAVDDVAYHVDLDRLAEKLADRVSAQDVAKHVEAEDVASFVDVTDVVAAMSNLTGDVAQIEARLLDVATLAASERVYARVRASLPTTFFGRLKWLLFGSL